MSGFIQILANLPHAIASLFGKADLEKMLAALVIGLVLLALLRLTRAVLETSLKKRGRERVVAVAGKGVYYLCFLAILFLSLSLAGMDVRALIGAAGIAGVVLGIAAQTSVSNIISGVFLVSEKSFMPGDVIRVGDTTGTVVSIDILSVKVRTFENQLVRVPNETLVKSVIYNLTRYPLRRLSVELSVSHGDSLDEVHSALDEAASCVPEALREPEPYFLADGYGPSGIKVIYGLWVRPDDMTAAKNGFYAAIQRIFRERGFRAPYARVRLMEAVSPGDQPPAGFGE